MTNVVEITGSIDSKFELSYTVFGEEYYKVMIKIRRHNNKVFDTLPCIVPKSKVDLSKDLIGKPVKISGLFTSYNENYKVLLTVRAQEFILLNKPEDQDINQIKLKGTICKNPYFRTTPHGTNITELIIAVNRRGKSDYIPCITWGTNAFISNRMKVGQVVEIIGRIQSREYKKYVDDIPEIKTTYEVSAFTIK